MTKNYLRAPPTFWLNTAGKRIVPARNLLVMLCVRELAKPRRI